MACSEESDMADVWPHMPLPSGAGHVRYCEGAGITKSLFLEMSML
ncbi:hypothetical protein AtDm6_2967 [Acetobacter tropicalis]|uniref:Uncharacterized protein n=1 Tax=Acetobacter tropicalis TaxID=104102 RepID=A0A094ZFH8_9PROT|nr:hypothetical protein AtDm6_2967 [Acetobacter tropicalis]